MGTRQPDPPDTRDGQRWPEWLQTALRVVLLLALAGLVAWFAWTLFSRTYYGTRLPKVIQDVRDLTPEAQKRNEQIKDLSSPPAGRRDK
jgi:hypothetical protein